MDLGEGGRGEGGGARGPPPHYFRPKKKKKWLKEKKPAEQVKQHRASSLAQSLDPPLKNASKETQYFESTAKELNIPVSFASSFVLLGWEINSLLCEQFPEQIQPHHNSYNEYR